MWYLFLQIWLWLILAFVLGWYAHWFFCCRDNKKGTDRTTKPEGLQHVRHHVAKEPAAVGAPLGFVTQPEQVDDLKLISGIGAKIETTLQGLGIYQYAQIAEWDEQQIDWVETHLSFPGRIQREDWCGQAAKLASGEKTEFAERMESDKVNHD